MANPEHLEILKQGVEVWNEWRVVMGETRPDLSEADLSNFNLEKANLSHSYLKNANLSGTNLCNANLDFSYLHSARLRNAKLRQAGLHSVNLCNADLTYTSLRRAIFINANLCGANLSNSNLNESDFRDANLSFTNLSSTALVWANLCYANLSKAILEKATFGNTLMGNTNLSNVVGLESSSHEGPSVINIQTLAQSGSLPMKFLRGCGLPDIVIEYLPSLLVDPIQFYSCFISYSSKDQAFAERLHADLQDRGVRCWFAPEDLRIGDRLRLTIDQTIRIYDKLLLVLSKSSIESDWVEQEVETALSQESDPSHESKRTVLFPIRIDDTILEMNEGWPALIKNTRHIGDFRRWETHREYQKAFDRLLRDLKAEER